MKPSFWQRVAVGSCLGLLLANPVTVMASDDLDAVSYTHLTLPTNREV